MTSLRKKFSKLRRWLAGCLTCTDCTTNVTCYGKQQQIDNHAVVHQYYYGNEGETRDDGRQGGGRRGGGS
jgi:hypothetical protein